MSSCARAVACLCVVTALGEARASPTTPTVWQQPGAHGEQVGKLANWNRDEKPPFFVDDLLLGRPPDELVDVIVDFNRPLSALEVDNLLESFGTVGYVGRVLSFALLSGVYVRDLKKIGKLSDVAMVEWQAPIRIASDVSSRAVQARASRGDYAALSAEDQGYHGTDVTVAVLDTGVDGVNPLAFGSRYRAGIEALVSSACPAPVCVTVGQSDLSRGQTHGTQVASIALGATIEPARVPKECRIPDEGMTADCGGIATEANLVDIRVCVSMTCDWDDVMRGLEWLLENVGVAGSAAEKVKVANLSFVVEEDDDGKNALAQLVNTLVWRGVVVVAAHGNASATHPLGTRASWSPGAASLAITVGAVDDDGTVTRDDDDLSEYSLIGPRCDPTTCTPGPDDEKPDLCAPGMRISGALPGVAVSYKRDSGTSFAAPVVAGAAAIVLGAKAELDPGSVKDLLERVADGEHSVSSPYPVWSSSFGHGTVNVGAAAAALPTSDVGFPYCDASAITPPGEPCTLLPPATSTWENDQDIDIVPAPVGSATSREIRATVKNWGKVQETVRVQFADRSIPYPGRWTHIGTREVVVPPNGTVVAEQPWTPPASGTAADVQVRIAFGLDTNHANNLTQRNALIVPPYSQYLVSNPYPEPVTVMLTARAKPTTWTCRLAETTFFMKENDLPHAIAWNLIPSSQAEGRDDRAICRIHTEVRSLDGARVLRDGATFESFAPRPCDAQLLVLDEDERPVPRARLRLRESVPRPAGIERLFGRQPVQRRLRTSGTGLARGKLVPFLPYEVEIRTGSVTRSGTIRAQCGPTPLRVTVFEDGLVAAAPALP